ncbi:MAG: hypothetical protein VX109_05030, partial [Planctomycetota bacterium]|nr:hypothetical protein [Planctomycetota bacterium]
PWTVQSLPEAIAPPNPLDQAMGAMCSAASYFWNIGQHRNTDSKMRSYDGQKFGFIQHPDIT